MTLHEDIEESVPSGSWKLALIALGSILTLFGIVAACGVQIVRWIEQV